MTGVASRIDRPQRGLRQKCEPPVAMNRDARRFCGSLNNLFSVFEHIGTGVVQ
jgi:hypothetical protein